MNSQWHNAMAGNDTDLLKTTVKVMTAYLSRNAVPLGDFPRLITRIHTALSTTGEGEEVVMVAAKNPAPAVSRKKSVTDEYIVCLEDGQKFKSLKRHLKVAYGMTPEQYREKWRLDPAYPMVAPNYTVVRLPRRRGLVAGGMMGSPGFDEIAVS
jgi:MucR family transcriptional regulator, transcriptional regulator of exopolysaccharide biosynthesis